MLAADNSSPIHLFGTLAYTLYFVVTEFGASFGNDASYRFLMTTLQDADIFFFISTIGFVLITILAIICFIMAIRILSKMSKLADRTIAQSDSMIKEVNDMFHQTKAALSGIWLFAKLFPRFFSRKNK